MLVVNNNNNKIKKTATTTKLDYRDCNKNITSQHVLQPAMAAKIL